VSVSLMVEERGKKAAEEEAEPKREGGEGIAETGGGNGCTRITMARAERTKRTGPTRRRGGRERREAVSGWGPARESTVWTGRAGMGECGLRTGKDVVEQSFGLVRSRDGNETKARGRVARTVHDRTRRCWSAAHAAAAIPSSLVGVPVSGFLDKG
jgi:hypothetical protein